MKDALTLLSEMEKKSLPQHLNILNNNVYTESRENTVLWKVIRSSRRKGYLIRDSQAPPSVHTNQLETIRPMLSAKKVTLG